LTQTFAPATHAVPKLPAAFGSYTVRAGRAATDMSPAGPQGFVVGDCVEYFSSSAGSWIPATVLAINPTGTYNLDCKPDVLPGKIRRNHSKLFRTFSVGESVEYFSTTHGGWIPANIIASCPNGNFDLDCKPDVPLAKIRAKCLAG